jgi:hypothetical protein
MSIESVAIALHHSRSTGSAKLVLIGIANHDGDGGSFPKVATLAKYANVHPRHVVRCLNTLGALGEIVIHQSAGGTTKTPETLRPNLYEFILECPPDCDRTKNHRLTGEKLGRNYKGQYPGEAVDKSTPDLVTPGSPSDTHVTTPSDTHVTTPSDTSVTTKNHPLEPPIESGLVSTSPALEAGVDKPKAKPYTGITAEQMERNKQGAAKARAALRAELKANEAKDGK